MHNNAVKQIIGPLEFILETNKLSIRRTQEQIILGGAVCAGVMLIYFIILLLFLPIISFRISEVWHSATTVDYQIDKSDITEILAYIVIGIVWLVSLVSVNRKLVYLLFSGRRIYVFDGDTGSIWFGSRRIGTINRISDINVKHVRTSRIFRVMLKRFEVNMQLGTFKKFMVIDDLSMFTSEAQAYEAAQIIKAFVDCHNTN